MDTKKKEVLGNLKNPGKVLRKKKTPTQVETHDFPKKELGKAVPYGVYDLQLNEAVVTVGISHDTAQFAVAAIRRWWFKLGKNGILTPLVCSSRPTVVAAIVLVLDSGESNYKSWPISWD